MTRPAIFVFTCDMEFTEYILSSPGIYKKLVAVSKKRGCEDIASWCHSISNHLYWAAASSGGDGELVREKWISITNHVCDIHQGHGTRYQACGHGTLDKNWIPKGILSHAIF